MLRKKFGTLLLSALLLLLTCLNFKPSFAQEASNLYGVFPRSGVLGTEVEMVLNGEGLQDLGELRGVIIQGQQVPLVDHEMISDHLIRVQIAIPEQTEIGETQIYFLFDNIRLFTDFVVLEGIDPDILPDIRQYGPREGQIDTEIRLSFGGVRLSGLGELGGVIIGNADIPVVDYGVESDESMFMTIYLPPETPIGEMDFRAYFENYVFADFFLVREPEPVAPGGPNLFSLSPQEGLRDTEMELLLEGEGFFDLGEIWGVTIAGIDIPIRDQRTESDNTMVVAVYLPADLPTGDTGIAFYFEDNVFEDYFYMGEAQQGPEQPGLPMLSAISPGEGQINTQVDLFLDGENFFELGDVLGVTIGGFEVPVQDYQVESNESMVVSVYLPEDTPRGDQRIVLFFENAEFEDDFSVTAPPDILIWIVGVLAAAGGFVGGRLTRPPRHGKENGGGKPDWSPPNVEFVVHMDLGTVKAKLVEPSSTEDTNPHFEVDDNNGEQKG